LHVIDSGFFLFTDRLICIIEANGNFIFECFNKVMNKNWTCSMGIWNQHFWPYNVWWSKLPWLPAWPVDPPYTCSYILTREV